LRGLIVSVEKYLANAKKYFGQGKYADAIYEYRRVLDLDPANKEALAAMSSLTDMPSQQDESQSEPGGKIKTNFLSHQAAEVSVPLSKQTPVVLLGVVVVIGALFGLYQLVTYYMNYDKIIALKYV